MRKLTALFLVFVMALGLCSCRDERLYTEEQFLAALEERYDAEFIILDCERVSGSKAVYKVAFKDDPDTDFEVINTLRTSGSDIGPKVNSITSNDLLYYSIGPDAFEGYMLDRKGKLASDYYILPFLRDASSSDGKYTTKYREDGDMLTIAIYSGDTEISSFSPCKHKDWRGLCWDKTGYNIWIQIHNQNLVCYSMKDDVWKLDEDAKKPDYIVYNIHPAKY